MSDGEPIWLKADWTFEEVPEMSTDESHLAFGQEVVEVLDRIYGAADDLLHDSDAWRSYIKDVENSQERLAPLWDLYSDAEAAFILAYLSGDRLPERVVAQFVSRESFASMSTEDYAAFLRANQDNFFERAPEFECHIKEFAEEFHELAREACRKGVVPISEDELTRRYESTEIAVYDQLSGAVYERPKPHEGYGIGGAFTVSERVARVVEVHELAEARHYTFHEMWHAVSGMNEGYDRDWRPDTRRCGLRCSKGDQFDLSVLNEPITEDLTLEITGGPDYGIYSDERVLLQDILVQGKNPVDRELFLNAYFEQGGVAQAIAHRHAGLELVTAIDAAHGDGFLKALDELAEAHGAAAAHSFLLQTRVERLPKARPAERADYFFRMALFAGDRYCLRALADTYQLSPDDIGTVMSVKPETVKRWFAKTGPADARWENYRRREQTDYLRATLGILDSVTEDPSAVRDELFVQQPWIIERLQAGDFNSVRERFYSAERAA